jgi:hypothetical protein
MLEPLEDRSLLSAGLSAAYGQLPLAFEVNQGQAAAQVDFQSRGSGYTLSLTASDARLALQNAAPQGGDVLDLGLVGANSVAQAVGLDPLVTRSNYLVGNDPSEWRTNIPNYGEVAYTDVYRGVDLVYHGNQGRLEYDFVVAPGADPGVVTLSIKGTKGLSLDAQGSLVLHRAGGDLTEQAPVLYQESGGVRQAVSGRFVLEGGDRVGFQVGPYDHSRALTIDPVLSYSTSFGTFGYGIAVDSAGEAFVAGSNGINTQGFGAEDGPQGVLVEKFNAAGTALLYSTVLSNTLGSASSIAVDAAGDAYITGMLGNIPTTPNAIAASGGAFVAVLDPTGSNLLYSTYLPGAGDSNTNYEDPGGAIAVDGSGNICVTGQADPKYGALPTTAGAYQSTPGSVYFAEINPNLSGAAALVYCTYLGGSSNLAAGTGVAVDASGNAYLTGHTNTAFPTTPGVLKRTLGGAMDAFVAKIDPNLSGSASLVYSTYLGGSGRDGYIGYFSSFSVQTGPAIAVDAAGDAYVTGSTNSTDFPTTRGAFQTKYAGPAGNPILSSIGDVFVSKLNPTGTALIYSTYLGGATGKDGGASIAVDAAGDVYVTGWTKSTDFPTKNPIQGQFQAVGSGAASAFVAVLNSTGTGLLFSTFLNGTTATCGFGIALDSSDNIYVTGADYYTSQSVGFVLKITLS